MPPIQSNSRNEIAKDIEDGIEKKRYKDCIHLEVLKHFPYADYGFSTHCIKGAFEWTKAEYPRKSEPFCNPRCHYFEDKKKGARVEKRRKLSRNVGYRFSRIWEGVMRFHWTERIVFLVILLFFVLYFTVPSVVPQFIELIKAFRGS